MAFNKRGSRSRDRYAKDNDNLNSPQNGHSTRPPRKNSGSRDNEYSPGFSGASGERRSSNYARADKSSEGTRERAYQGRDTDRSTGRYSGYNRSAQTGSASYNHTKNSQRAATESAPANYPFKTAQAQEEERKSVAPRRYASTAQFDQQPDQQQYADDDSTAPIIIFGRNTIRETIKSERSIDKIYIVESGAQDGSLREIMKLAKDAKIVITPVGKQKLDELCMPFGYGGKTANHQGIVAQLPSVEYVTVDDILQSAKEKEETPFILIIDGMNDPHNLGAIIRTANCAGVHGIVIPKRRSVGITAAVAKASAGAVMHAKVARVSNVNTVIERFKKEGIWIAGADMKGREMYKAPLSGAIALVIGSEDEGLSALVKKNCDFLVSIPLRGEVNSLNAANAASVIMYEKIRQDISTVNNDAADR